MRSDPEYVVAWVRDDSLGLRAHDSRHAAVLAAGRLRDDPPDSLSQRSEPGRGRTARAAQQLAERCARNELDKQEHRQRRYRLRGVQPAGYKVAAKAPQVGVTRLIAVRFAFELSRRQAAACLPSPR